MGRGGSIKLEDRSKKYIYVAFMEETGKEGWKKYFFFLIKENWLFYEPKVEA